MKMKMSKIWKKMMKIKTENKMKMRRSKERSNENENEKVLMKETSIQQ